MHFTNSLSHFINPFRGIAYTFCRFRKGKGRCGLSLVQLLPVAVFHAMMGRNNHFHLPLWVF